MATLKKIPNSYLAPMRTLPQQELADCYITNPAAARLLTYGTRDTRLSDPPHDHGQDGGLVRVEVPVCQVSFGPEKIAGVSYVGIQIRRSTVLGASPRILGTAPVPLRGGQTQLSGLLSVAYDAIADIALYVTLRPYSEANRDLQQGLQTTVQVTFTPGAAPEERALGFTFSDLTPIGDTRYDREVELVVWQAYLPPGVVTSGHRLVGVYLDVLATEARARQTERSELPRQIIGYQDIKTGAILGQDLGRKLRDTHNGLLRGMLGRAPGLTNDGRSDTTRPYQQDLWCAHQHQGIDVPDGCGSFGSDGAVERNACFTIVASHSTASVADYAGITLCPSGAFDATSLRIEARASIPAGLGALDLRFELAVGTLQQVTRLFVHVDVRGFDGVSICTGVASGVHQQQAALDGDSLFVCEVDPLDNNLFVPSRKRRLARAGLWTLAALRQVPSVGVLTGPQTAPPGMRTSNHQISETVRLSLTHPKLRTTDTPHATADYRVILRWELQTPEGVTAVDGSTKFNWALGLPSRGF